MVIESMSWSFRRCGKRHFFRRGLTACAFFEFDNAGAGSHSAFRYPPLSAVLIMIRIRRAKQKQQPKLTKQSNPRKFQILTRWLHRVYRWPVSLNCKPPAGRANESSCGVKTTSRSKVLNLRLKSHSLIHRV